MQATVADDCVSNNPVYMHEDKLGAHADDKAQNSATDANLIAPKWAVTLFPQWSLIMAPNSSPPQKFCTQEPRGLAIANSTNVRECVSLATDYHLAVE